MITLHRPFASRDFTGYLEKTMRLGQLFLATIKRVSHAAVFLDYGFASQPVNL